MPHSAKVSRATANPLPARGTGVERDVEDRLDDLGRLDADVQRSAKVSAQWFSASPIAGTPDEIADVALFLLCDAAAYVTASRYFADGGLS